jgi:thiol-disulfide isomerase/thioredoxin
MSILFLYDDSFDKNGKLLIDTGNMHTIVMCQASWCGHCTSSKPAFEKLSIELMDQVLFATIDCSGKLPPNQQKLADRVGPLFGVRGFPTYLCFDQNGDIVMDFKVGDRSVEGLRKSLRAVGAI